MKCALALVSLTIHKRGLSGGYIASALLGSSLSQLLVPCLVGLSQTWLFSLMFLSDALQRKRFRGKTWKAGDGVGIIGERCPLKEAYSSLSFPRFLRQSERPH